MSDKDLFDTTVEVKEPSQAKTREQIIDSIRKTSKESGKKDTKKDTKGDTQRKKTRAEIAKEPKLTEDIGTAIVTMLDLTFVAIGLEPITPMDTLEKNIGSSPDLYKEYAKAISQYAEKKVGDGINKKAIEWKFWLLTGSILVTKMVEAKSKGIVTTGGFWHKLKGVFSRGKSVPLQSESKAE